MKRTKNYLTDVTVINGEGETPTKIELTYEEMPRTFRNWYESFWWAVAFSWHVVDAIEYIYSIQTSNENKKEIKKTYLTFMKWLRREHLGRNTSAGVFRYKTVMASGIWRKNSVIFTLCETANTKFKVELYKKGEENS